MRTLIKCEIRDRRYKYLQFPGDMTASGDKSAMTFVSY